MKKLFITLVSLIFFFSSSHSDEIKIGHGYFEEGNKWYENHMTEITYVYDNRNLPFDLTPIAGGLKHGAGAYMIYAGVQKKFETGRFALIPSFAPGYYDDGSEKNLGYDLQFKSQIELSVELFHDYSLSYAWSHISNADLGNQNPGANNEMLFITKKF